MDTLLSLLADSARRNPTARAMLDTRGRTWTYAEVLSRVHAIARQLATFGVGRGDRVAIVVPNGPDAALDFLGTAAAASAAPLNPAYSEDEFTFYLEDLQARVAIIDERVAPAAIASARRLGVRILEPEDLGTALADPDDAPSEPQPDDVALVLHTSGTTSRPKIVPLTHANLTCNARNIARSLELAPADRCLNVMPLFHVHGLVGAVLGSLAAGASVVCTPGFDAGQFFDWLREYSPSWYTAVPTMHQAVLGRASTEAEPGKHGLRFIRSCSSALPPKLMAEMEAAFRVPVVEALGMTEASHQVASNPLPPRQRKPGSVGLPTGPDVAILDAEGKSQPANTPGEVALRGPNVTRGYASPPDANAKAFTNGWFRTGDQGLLDTDGYLFLTGRLKEIINRGGEKVSPREIDEALLEHPAIAQAVAFALPHATLGEDLAAAIVLKPGATARSEEIREFAFGRLAAFKVPSLVLIVDAIPKGPTGKLQRIGLAGKLRHRLTTPFVAPRDEIEALIAGTWQEVLGREAIGVHDNFFVLGGDSLRGTRVMTRVNELFAIDLPVSTAFRQPTLEQLARRVRESATPARLAEIAAMLAEVRAMSAEDVQRELGS